MISYRNFKTIILFLMLVCCTSCGMSSCDRWGNAPRTEYYIQGGDVSFTSATSVEKAVQDFVRSHFSGRELHMGLWRVDADDSDERYKIESGPVCGESRFHGDGIDGPDMWLYSGMARVDGSTLGFDLHISHPWMVETSMEFSNLDARGTCNYSDAQRLIKQVRLPAWSNNTSTDTAEVNWELTGDFNGEQFSVSFTQVFHGKSRYPMYPYQE